MSTEDSLYRIRRGAAPPHRDAARVDRRSFIQLIGAGFAAGCAQEVPRNIVPYARRPAQVVPGEPVSYATSMVLDGHATGLLVESHEGRPVKIEANPEHPATLGGTNLFQQAAIRALYDDDRARHARHGGEAIEWETLLGRLRAPRPDGGAGLRLLLPPTSAPLLLRLLRRLHAQAPKARVSFHAPLATGQELAGLRLAFGRALSPIYHFDRAEVIVSLEGDFLDGMPFSLRYARAWAQRRHVGAPTAQMNRLYVVESALSPTGSVSDRRLRRRSADVLTTARRLAARIPGLGPAGPARASDPNEAAFVEAATRDLLAAPRGSTVVLAGERQPPLVHALAAALNEALGNVGSTVTWHEPAVPAEADWLQPLPELVREMRAGAVDTLVMIDVNPVYDAPADLDFASALARVGDSVTIAYHEHETAEQSRWFGPLAHFLESWGDARAYDGTPSIIQPLIQPLVDARPESVVLAALTGARQPDGHALLREAWRAELGADDQRWLEVLRRGFAPGATPAVRPALRRGDVLGAAERAVEPEQGLALELHPSPTVRDGRFTNNPWLLEQPEPFTKITWDNAALISPATARRLEVTTESLVDLSAGGVTISAPVFVTPGLADDVVTVWLGYGRRGQERQAAGVGFDAYPWRRTDAPYVVPSLQVTPRPGRHRLARTQLHTEMEGRPDALKTTLAAYRADPQFTKGHKGPLDSLLPQFQYQGLQWAMSIDLSLCTGCSSCMVACQAENNVLVVGKENVLLGREMHWLRIDTYYDGPRDDPGVVHQPMLCQHCEDAPCEYVCPVNATVHSADGLNEMIYNRCVGTRFCSNNCPYKVRRFNYFDYRDRVAANRGAVDMQFNPEVTVRERGVMEKCTYCVQRIRRTEIKARLEERPVRPGEVVTACQAACPTGAIQFGSLSHRDTPMVRWRQEERSYAVLHDLGTQPRTMYLARVDNPGPEPK